MNDSTRNNSENINRLAAPVPESEILIGRMIDGEASSVDRQRFDAMADVDPLLWRRLALRQQDMAALVMKVDERLGFADRIDLPVSGDGDDMKIESHLNRGGLKWWLAVSGWAAMIAIATVWAGMHRFGGAESKSAAIQTNDRGSQVDRLSPDDHLREYLKAPYVVNEMPPTLLQVEELSDGRKALRILRRIEEIAFIQPDAEIPVKDDGELSKSPAEIRGAAPAIVPHRD